MRLYSKDVLTLDLCVFMLYRYIEICLIDYANERISSRVEMDLYRKAGPNRYRSVPRRFHELEVISHHDGVC